MKTIGPDFLASLTPRPYFWRYILTYVALFMGSTLAKVKVRGRENLPKKGPFVVACNHFSDYDPLFFSYAIRQPVSFIAASDQEIDLVFAWAPFIYGWIPVDRTKLSPSTIKMSISVLKNGNILGIFPDGGVSYNLLSKPKNGAVFLSNLGSAPIVPMSIYGAERAWEGALRGIRSRVCVNIGKPFGPYTLSGNKKDKEKILNRVGREMMCRIASLLPENQRGHFKNEKKIINRLQKQNKIIPDDHRYFKPAPE